jgi:hypothetical protein
MTVTLLHTSGRFFEGNPVARWFFARWNVTGLVLFKFSIFGGVTVVSEFIERRRPGWGRFVLFIGCLGAAYAFYKGLTLYMAHQVPPPALATGRSTNLATKCGQGNTVEAKITKVMPGLLHRIAAVPPTRRANRLGRWTQPAGYLRLAGQWAASRPDESKSAILARHARGNPPELQAKLDAGHERFLAMVKVRREAKPRESRDAGHSDRHSRGKAPYGDRRSLACRGLARTLARPGTNLGELPGPGFSLRNLRCSHLEDVSAGAPKQ